MSTPLDWIRDRAAELPPPAGQAVNSGVDVAEGVIFADGSLPAGTNPADIYSWFHDGPGTAGYERVAATLGALEVAFADYTAEIQAARRSLEAGWRGVAAEQSIGSFQPLLDSSAKLERHATNAGRSTAGQIVSFNDTKYRVVPVPAQPPTGPGMRQFTEPFAPDNLTADTAVAGYQLATYNNQDAYGGYQSQTTPQGGALPQDQADGSVTTRKGAADDGSVRTPPVTEPGPPVSPPPPTPVPPGPRPVDTRQSETGSVDSRQVGTQQVGAQSADNPGQPGGTDPSRATTSSTTTPGLRPSTTTPSLGDRPLPGPATIGGRSGGYGSGTSGSVGRGSRTTGGGNRGVQGEEAGRRGTGRLAAAGPNATRQGVTGGASGRGGGQARGQFGSGPAGGGSRGDDEEHTTKYVLKTDHDNELVGDLPPHAPSVIDGRSGDDD